MGFDICFDVGAASGRDAYLINRDRLCRLLLQLKYRNSSHGSDQEKAYQPWVCMEFMGRQD
jgi:hypothetical protein